MSIDRKTQKAANQLKSISKDTLIGIRCQQGVSKGQARRDVEVFWEMMDLISKGGQA